MSSFSCMYVIPQALYKSLLEQGDQKTKDSLTANNIRQLNHLKVEVNIFIISYKTLHIMKYFF